MQWNKLGLVFKAEPTVSWRRTHACLPAPIHRRDDEYRVFFACRDEQNRSHVAFFDILLRAPYPILRVAERPVLAPGALGGFDDHGVYASSVVFHQGRYYMYTVGWNQGCRQPLFYSSMGLAVSDDGENFRRWSAAPLLGRSEHDPCSVVSSLVQVEEDDRWRMWYVSCVRWEQTDQGLHSYYHVKYAESNDGIAWRRTGHVAFDFAAADERNIGRPSIVREADGYRAWLPYSRNDGYRIGYAESPDALHWVRKDDEAGITLSDSGWDSKMVAHPAIVRHRGLWYMFYNGNQFGKDGVGLAVADPASLARAA